MRRQASSVTPCWKRAALAEPAEDLEGLAVLVHGDGDVEASELGLQLRGGAGQAAGAWVV